ncbi:uncharacterized protein K452DRAFT_19019 [Aplosporella prunicola CBS 121167]|uniref:Uncharacterized protein n=1 Tax=Aplosporella prunicola CBS 121167 TaxID=1176127 RepID=A0A6A6BEG5_9PEZI|nr:uncharacterized protein K452DRAFT_19019 [Aplosporella prunicola CBS 121167]KAF2142456.1 hypothetical protein K452DRAFT_19019 [Aplosporella prunicola CBS 121167]
MLARSLYRIDPSIDPSPSRPAQPSPVQPRSGQSAPRHRPKNELTTRIDPRPRSRDRSLGGARSGDGQQAQPAIKQAARWPTTDRPAVLFFFSLSFLVPRSSARGRQLPAPATRSRSGSARPVRAVSFACLRAREMARCLAPSSGRPPPPPLPAGHEPGIGVAWRGRGRERGRGVCKAASSRLLAAMLCYATAGWLAADCFCCWLLLLMLPTGEGSSYQPTNLPTYLGGWVWRRFSASYWQPEAHWAGLGWLAGRQMSHERAAGHAVLSARACLLVALARSLFLPSPPLPASRSK